MKFRFIPIAINNKKVGELTNTAVTLDPGGEQQHGTDGVLGESDGITTTEINFDTVVPVGGASVDPAELALRKVDVDASFPMNGKIYVVTGRIVKVDVNSASKTGTSTGKYMFRGGEPKVTG